jgi:integrase
MYILEEDIAVSHIRYTILRSGTHYYNRRVPKHAVESYGSFIRLALSEDEHLAEVMAERLSQALEASWRNADRVTPVCLEHIVASFKPRLSTLSEFSEEYLSLKSIDPAPTHIAVDGFIQLLGDRPIEEYSREDAKAYLQFLVNKKNRTGTIRRRINSLSSIFNFAFAELDLDKRNPLSRLIIRGEGADVVRRGTFTLTQLKEGYEEALSSHSNVRLLMPILGETGCRLAEIAGLRVCDIDLQEDIIFIRGHQQRRLKNAGSERVLPLIGYGREAIKRAIQHSDGTFLFPRYLSSEGIRSTHASNALNLWLKPRFGGLTAHSLRHTMRDRLRAVAAPIEMIDQIGGWSSINTAGSKYGDGFSVDHIREWMDKIRIE